MAGLDPAIHAEAVRMSKWMAGSEAGHDEWGKDDAYWIIQVIETEADTDSSPPATGGGAAIAMARKAL